jgi:Icc-related predicted phosphoesterase
MKIACVSDLHGYLPMDLPGADTLVIAGDICPVRDHKVPRQAIWLKTDFDPWLKSLDYKNIVVIAGNHDWVFETRPDMVSLKNCTYLKEESVIIDGVMFYGHPFTPRFCNWAFNSRGRELKQIAARINPDTNVLVTHGPPLGILDRVPDRNGSVELTGCQYHAYRTAELTELKAHIFGHIHCQHGAMRIDDVDYINASYVGEDYLPAYEPKVIEV